MTIFDDLFKTNCMRVLRNDRNRFSMRNLFEACVAEPAKKAAEKVKEGINDTTEDIENKVIKPLDNRLEELFDKVEKEISDIIPENQREKIYDEIFNLIPNTDKLVPDPEKILPEMKPLIIDTFKNINTQINKADLSLRKTLRETESDILKKLRGFIGNQNTQELFQILKEISRKRTFFNKLIDFGIRIAEQKLKLTNVLDLKMILGNMATIPIPAVDFNELINDKMKVNVFGKVIDLGNLAPHVGKIDGMVFEVDRIEGIFNTKILDVQYRGTESWAYKTTSPIDVPLIATVRMQNVNIIARLKTRNNAANVEIVIRASLFLQILIDFTSDMKFHIKQNHPGEDIWTTLELDMCLGQILLRLSDPQNGVQIKIHEVFTRGSKVQLRDCPSGHLSLLAGGICSKKGIIGGSCPNGYEDMRYLRLCKNIEQIEAWVIGLVRRSITDRRAIGHGIVQHIVDRIMKPFKLGNYINKALYEFGTILRSFLRMQDRKIYFMGLEFYLHFGSIC